MATNLNSIRFTCTALSARNKVGALKPDADGYYTVVLGGLNVFNSVGEYYTADGVKQLFEESSLLMKRVKRGKLRGECGHPKQMPGEKLRDYSNRLFLINERNASHHIAEIWLESDSVKDESGRPVIAIMGKVCPSGPQGDALKKQLDNPKENVCFSIRAFTDDDLINGVVHRRLKNIITWDWVNDCGIAVAEKYYSPACESIGIVSLEEHVILRSDVEAALRHPAMVAQESASHSIMELMNVMGWSKTTTQKPAYLKW
jgi:hypothetical protein